MLSHADNEVLTRTDQGTPMGETMRRYWMPALLSSEIAEPDCAPVRVRLLGEDLIAFRDTQGRIGLLDQFCPHRLASLFLARNEDCGLRCVYHGWKFDVSGRCLDMMNEPPDSDYKDEVRIKSYPAGAPVRVRLLGEDLIAFRDTQGRIGLLDQFCPHRLASLFLARNEDCGLRCVYHGWKFDVSGRCLDMMNEPPDSDYKDEVRIKSYPAIEQGGVVWAYLGAPEKQPAAPNFEWTQVMQSHRRVSKVRQSCNWLQGLEGGIDTAHAPILHRTITPDTDKPGIGINSDLVLGGAPNVEVELTDYGYRYAGVRSLGERGNYVRSYHYVLPFHQMRPRQRGYKGEDAQPMIAGHMWVPIDDENVMIYNWIYSFGDKGISDEEWLQIVLSLVSPLAKLQLASRIGRRY